MPPRQASKHQEQRSHTGQVTALEMLEDAGIVLKIASLPEQPHDCRAT